MKGETESDSGKMKTNNGQNKCKEVKFGLNQPPKMSRGKDQAEREGVRGNAGRWEVSASIFLIPRNEERHSLPPGAGG